MILYHISETDLSGKTLKPRIPSNFMTKNGYEDGKTPRVSFSKSIDGCLMGLGGNIQNKKFYVYKATGKYKTKNITNRDVPDQSLTDEVWVTSNVELTELGRIVTTNAVDTPYEFTYGKDIKADLYKWNWKWVYKKSTINESAVTKKLDIDFLINIKEKDINKSLFMELFGEFDNEPRFNPSDTITIPPNSYGPPDNRNQNSFTTTVGLWLFNKYLIEDNMFEVLGYVNKEVDGGVLKDFNRTMSYSIMEGYITLENLKTYLMKQQHIMRFVSVLSPNHTMKMLKTSNFLAKKKKKLIEDNKEALERGDEVVSSQIETELLSDASKYLEGDPSMDMYKSKARGEFDNNFKNMFIMKGAIMNPDPAKGFDITTSNYIDGISKDEYAVFANSLVGGGYAKAKNTAVGGYWSKLYTNAFQHVHLDPEGSDCKTDRYIEVELTPKTIGMYMYSFIIEKGSLVELNSKNMSKYSGKTVKMRYSSLCESKTGICNACMGNLFYKLGTKDVGLLTTIIPNTIMNASMKKFHNQQIEIIDMDLGKCFGN